MLLSLTQNSVQAQAYPLLDVLPTLQALLPILPALQKDIHCGVLVTQ
jgi:hypothetical protein